MVELSPMSRFAADLLFHEVGVDEVFFSVTDARGVIRQANDIFVRLSRHERETLVGAPHNIIRHPDMPAGLFRLLWDSLQAGRPFAGYIRNRAADDSTYDTLATVTPLPDGGYLSVRTRPVTDHFATARELYHCVNDLEHRLIEEGSARRDAAEQGLGRLSGELEERDIGAYEQLQWRILPDEVAERERRSAGLPGRGDATGPLAELLAAVHHLFSTLDAFMDSQRDIAETAEALARAGTRLGEDTTAAVRVTGQMDRLDLSGPERTLLLAPLEVWTTMHGIVGDYVAELSGMLDELGEIADRTRFHIALARLHATVTASFATGLENIPAPGDPALEVISSLTDALRDGVSTMHDQVVGHRRLSGRVAAKVRSVVSLMEIPHSMVADWLVDSDVEVLAGDAGELVAEVRRAVEGTAASISELQTLGGRLAAETTPQLETLNTDVDRISAATDAYREGVADAPVSSRPSA